MLTNCNIMSAFANEPVYIKVVLFLLYSNDIPYTALIKEMVRVNTMSKSALDHSLLHGRSS